MKVSYVYILASQRRGTLYIGVTARLIDRLRAHRSGCYSNSFSKKYCTHLLVYYEVHQSIADAIKREKQLKNWQRIWKIYLVEQHNPMWQDLSSQLIS